MTQKIRWGILSTAQIATQKVIPAMKKSIWCDVKAIASRDITKAKVTAHELDIEKYYDSYEELLADSEIDAVYIPLPNHMHVPWTIKALEAGKHVLCEKPIGLNATEALRLIEAITRFPELKVMEAFMYRFHPQWEKVSALLKEGAIGEVKTVHTHFSYYNADPDNIRNRPEAGGGALMDIGCYCISFPRFIFNEEPISVLGNMEYDPVMHTDWQTNAILNFASGKTATFTCSTQLMPFQRTIISGTIGQINIQIPVNAPTTESTRIELITRENVIEYHFDPVDQYTLEADAFCRAILNDKAVPTPLRDAISNMKVVDAIVLSAKEGKRISIS